MPALFGKQAAGITLTRLWVCKSAALLKALLSGPTAGPPAVARVSIKMTHGTEYFSTLSSLQGKTIDLWQPGEGGGRKEGEKQKAGRM